MLITRLTEGRRCRSAGNGADTEARHRYPACRHLEEEKTQTSDFDQTTSDVKDKAFEFLPSSVWIWVCSWVQSDSSGPEGVEVQCRVWSGGEESDSSAAQSPAGTEHRAGNRLIHKQTETFHCQSDIFKRFYRVTHKDGIIMIVTGRRKLTSRGGGDVNDWSMRHWIASLMSSASTLDFLACAE